MNKKRCVFSTIVKTAGFLVLSLWIWSLIVDAVIPAIKEFRAEDDIDDLDDFEDVDDCEECL